MENLILIFITFFLVIFYFILIPIFVQNYLHFSYSLYESYIQVSSFTFKFRYFFYSSLFMETAVDGGVQWSGRGGQLGNGINVIFCQRVLKGQKQNLCFAQFFPPFPN